jgi:hypothetical protein
MTTIPTRVLAGVVVPDTPLIAKALAFAETILDTIIYNHVVRSWLLGHYIASHIPALQDRDVEAHAVAAILHDLGWASSDSLLISKDKRFEVDGANAARVFIEREGKVEEWDKHRLQIVWDSIALHTTASIAVYKEIEVQATVHGIRADFVGPENAFGSVLTREVWDGVVREYPRKGLKDGCKAMLCELCKSKPETTYNNWVGDFGEAFVEGYSKVGKRIIDVMDATVE